MPIHFFNEGTGFKMPNKKKVKDWISQACNKEGVEVGEINYIFCSDSYLLNLNKSYLNHTTFTDIITFDYSERNKISGDIFISPERIKENSEKFETTFDDELRRVAIHGILHLIGYTDKKARQKSLMRKKENQYLSLWNK